MQNATLNQMVVSRVYNEIGFNFRSLNNYLVGTVEQLPIWLLFAVGVSFRFGRPNLNCGFWLSHVSPILSFFFFGVLLWFSLKNFEFGRRKVTWTHFIWKCSRDETQRNSPIFLSLFLTLCRVKRVPASIRANWENRTDCGHNVNR